MGLHSAGCVKSQLFFTTGSPGSQGPEFCTLQPLLVHQGIFFSLMLATGLRVLNSAPPMLFQWIMRCFQWIVRASVGGWFAGGVPGINTVIIGAVPALCPRCAPPMFSKIDRYFGFPNDSDYTATKMKACLGPGTPEHARKWPKSDFFWFAGTLGFSCWNGGGGGGRGAARGAGVARLCFWCFSRHRRAGRDGRGHPVPQRSSEGTRRPVCGGYAGRTLQAQCTHTFQPWCNNTRTPPPPCASTALSKHQDPV